MDKLIYASKWLLLVATCVAAVVFAGNYYLSEHVNHVYFGMVGALFAFIMRRIYLPNNK